MATANDVPVSMQRAGFLASVYAVVGVSSLLVAGGVILTAGIDLASGYNVITGVVFLLGAGYTHKNPKSIDRGTDRAPRRWFEFAGVIVSVMIACVLLVLIGVTLF